jgi:hypothetical protein
MKIANSKKRNILFIKWAMLKMAFFLASVAIIHSNKGSVRR